MGFGQSLSGLNAAAKDLDVIGNNIANSGTVGFKSGSATFADVYSNAQIGMGVEVASINQNFTAGTVDNTGNQFDMAVDGPNGLFRVVDTSGNIFYTRNGQFHRDDSNYIVNAQGQRLTGFDSTGTNLVPIKVPTSNMKPASTSAITFTTNLDGNADVITAAFDPTDPTTYTHQQPMTVYDSLGNTHQLTQYFAKRAPTGTPPESNWDVYYRLDGQPMDIPDATTTPETPVKLTFDGNGELDTTTNPDSTTIVLNSPGGTGSPASTLSMNVNYAGSTQFGGDFAPNFVQDGYATGEYASMSVAADGTIIASYTNGKTQNIGTLVLANFNNLQGLKPVGGNAWAETADSGQPILGQPGTNSLANIKGQSVEDSNVDLSQELVNMIIAQRTYQANAQSIKTQDQVVQSLLNMS